ncbi:ankyrin repeat domain-containing protein [Prosthecobacter sp.]|uniref:ankyrin repeat domain-containing protein n=1 Tax=Prosthecobacter sp. TaxID=1965333 RepID=UPI002ABCBA7D|nr:ankyrin repeat domain-containing protein [Prosthecobacter sp.]MDZ4405912.1 ankyrin repeat domain-containing protein [Prosthecobacter sp.]
MNPLLTAIVDDDRKAVQALLKADGGLVTRLIQEPKLHQAKIFHWIYVGDTALHLAAAGYRVEIIRLLLKAGANPNAAANHRRSSPLHYAANGFITGPAWDAYRQVETIRCLLDAGADLHAQDKNGATPLHRAVRTRSAAAVRCLLQAGSDPTRENLSGNTPFHLAVQNTGRGGSGAAAAIEAQREIIKAFLAAGISSELKNGSGKSVVDAAKSAWIRAVLAAVPRNDL